MTRLGKPTRVDNLNKFTRQKLKLDNFEFSHRNSIVANGTAFDNCLLWAELVFLSNHLLLLQMISSPMFPPAVNDLLSPQVLSAWISAAGPQDSVESRMYHIFVFVAIYLIHMIQVLIHLFTRCSCWYIVLDLPASPPATEPIDACQEVWTRVNMIKHHNMS